MSVPENQSSGRLPLGIVFIVGFLCFLWGGNAVSIKLSNQGIPPLMTATLRSVIACSLVWAYARTRGWPVAFPPEYARHSYVIGFLFGVEFLLFYWGMVFTTASRAAIFFNTTPFWVTLGAHFLVKGDRLSLRKSIGLLLAFSGVVLVFQAKSDDLPPNYWIGDLMQLGGAVFWAAVTLYVKRTSQMVQLNFCQTLFAQLFFAIPVLAFGSLIFESFEDVNLNPLTVGALVYQSVIVASASYLVWFWLLHRFAVSRLTVFIFLTPLFGVILGGWILDEPVTLLIWMGLTGVASGVYLVNR